MSYLHLAWLCDIQTTRIIGIYPRERHKSFTHSSCNVCWCPGGWFNIKMSSYQYKKYHCGDKTILRPSYLHNGISYTDKMISLYWIRALAPCAPRHPQPWTWRRRQMKRFCTLLSLVRWPVDSSHSNTELWCFLWSAPDKTVEQTIETLVIWEAIALIMTSL